MMTQLLYQGHGSFRLTLDDGRIVYVDPYAGKGYDLPADLILVTHNHRDHNRVNLCACKPACRVITSKEALAGGTHNLFDVDGIGVEAVEARNLMHNPKKCVGYIITVDGITLYAAGDTSETTQMGTFAARQLDYALFPGDGIMNMGPAEASLCAKVIRAKHNILIHMKPGSLYSPTKAEAWDAPDKIIIRPEESIELHHG